METRQAVSNLSQFVRAMVAARIKSTKAFNVWKKDPEVIRQMNEWFAYEQKEGMPRINALISVDFHPQAPLLLLNYSPVAHNTLHEFPAGWTKPLRQCRGIVFDRKGKLVAKPFEKFFNDGEHPETRAYPTRESWEATEKKDGHLGIIFEYKGKIYMTTRGRFVSPTGLIARKMLDAYVTKNDWTKNYNPEETILVEIIIPETKVHLQYEGFNDFILIGATNRETLADYDFTNLTMISERLHLPLVRKWRGKSLEELKKLLKDRSIKNQEGFVVRFHGGLRSKFKFESYIGLMVQSKLSYTYLMQRKISGNLERMISTLPEEIYAIALQMVEKLNLTIAEKLEPKEKWQKLYLLIPEEDCTDYYKSICRKYVKTFYK